MVRLIFVNFALFVTAFNPENYFPPPPPPTLLFLDQLSTSPYYIAPKSKRQGHENQENDHQLIKHLIFKQILLLSIS